MPKKGDLSDVNNYRGITLTSILSKIYSHILDNRLRSLVYIYILIYLMNVSLDLCKIKVQLIAFLFYSLS